MIYIVDLEAVETRYTGQWKSHIPSLLREQGHDVQIISGPEDVPSATTPGAFLNFGGTNIYKSRQVEEISRLFCAGAISPSDHFLFTDAWHPGIINLKYMSELLGIPVKIHALWHAGSYDPQDFLGRLIGNTPWVRDAERSFFGAIDYNYFATDFHIDMFSDIFLDLWAKESCIKDKKIIRSGWPMEYMERILTPYKNNPKRDIILFPHRVAPEKQLDIFLDLEKELPQYEFIVCQDKQLSKNEYHTLLGQSKIVFSANLQETLGISTCAEAPLVNSIPLAPNRLSYTEIFANSPEFLYPSEWTLSWEQYQNNKKLLVNKIIDIMDNYQQYQNVVEKYLSSDYQKFFHSNELCQNLK